MYFQHCILLGANTIDRIIDVFPPHQQQQIRVQLSSVIQGVISQQLIPRKDITGRVAAIEIMVAKSGNKELNSRGKDASNQFSDTVRFKVWYADNGFQHCKFIQKRCDKPR